LPSCNLAQRSAASAKEIRELIQASGATVQKGGELAGEAEESMQQVVESGKRVADVIGEIEAASREQASGIEQINRAMAQMDNLTQRDAQMAEDLITTAEMLETQSQQMLAAISAFSMRHEDAGAPVAATQHAPPRQRRAAVAIARAA
jgi:aerotaxis receptor